MKLCLHRYQASLHPWNPSNSGKVFYHYWLPDCLYHCSSYCAGAIVDQSVNADRIISQGWPCVKTSNSSIAALFEMHAERLACCRVALWACLRSGSTVPTLLDHDSYSISFLLWSWLRTCQASGSSGENLLCPRMCLKLQQAIDSCSHQRTKCRTDLMRHYWSTHRVFSAD